MSPQSHRFRLGDLQCVALSDGSLDYPLRSLFANAATEEVEQVLRERGLPVEYVTTPYTCLYVDTREHQVLLDMGAGNLGRRTGKLVQSMAAAGINPGGIDTVVITHAHPDHIGGTLDARGQPTYSNARYYISRDEWGFWFSELAVARTPERFVRCARDNLKAIRDRVTLLDREGEILPGVSVIPAPGHTPGHMVIAVRSAGECLLYIGDTVLHPLHLEHPNWSPIYDILPGKADSSKRAVFDLAAEIGAWVIGQHFPPFPGLGRVAKQREGWVWQPAGSTVLPSKSPGC